MRHLVAVIAILLLAACAQNGQDRNMTEQAPFSSGAGGGAS